LKASSEEYEEEESFEDEDSEEVEELMTPHNYKANMVSTTVLR